MGGTICLEHGSCSHLLYMVLRDMNYTGQSGVIVTTKGLTAQAFGVFAGAIGIV
jgi:hypothetical protein